MAGKLVVDTIDTDNSFITLNVQQSLIATMNVSGIYSNTGVKMIGANGTVSNTAITGLVTASQIANVANTQITGNIISSQISPSITLTTPIISGNLNLDSAGTTGIRVPTANTISFHTAGTENVRIDATGNVGIGTSSPGCKFEVVGLVRATSLTNPTSGSGIEVGYDGTQGIIQAFSNRVTNTAVPINIQGDLKMNSGYGSSAIAYGCRAWVNFNGTGTVAIRGSGNVSSITDGGVGIYTVNLTTAMPDANYVVVGSADRTTGVRQAIVSIGNGIGVMATSSVGVNTLNDGTTLVDAAYVGVSIFR